jgi:allantoin racemase
VETIECIYDVAMCTPWLLEEIQKSEDEGYDAVIIACMADPGLYAARELMTIPVIGAAETSYLLAIALAHKFSVMEPTKAGAPLTKQLIVTYGFERFLASIRVLNLAIAEIAADEQKLKDTIIREGRRAIEDDGAEAIVLGCGFMSGKAQEIQQALGVPVIDPWATAMKLAEMLVSLGLSQSKRAYMPPPPKRREI